ncbi:MAG: hypothetical protein U5O39_04855 [Gammaproteobacteria bacterium]|nr:hypothetical protein [Gammaproteobacteria bacterium]
MATSAPQSDDFFLPDLCKPQSLLFLVLIAELLVMVMVLLQSSLVDFDWQTLGIASLLTQWIVLGVRGHVVAISALSCRGCPSPWQPGHPGVLILVSTAVFSIAGEWLLLNRPWQIEETGAIVRNLLVAGVMTGIAFRYFLLSTVCAGRNRPNSVHGFRRCNHASALTSCSIR